MIVPGSASALLLRTADTGYNVERSLRFNSSDSAYLSRTPASAGNRKTWTWAGWVKRSNLNTFQTLFSAYNAGNDTDFLALYWTSANALQFSAWNTTYLISTPVYRDASAWYHIVCALDTTQATTTNRARIYINGSEITTFSTDNRSSLTQNTDRAINGAFEHTIGRRNAAAGTSLFLDGYLADIHLIDGQALTPSSFTEVDATTGQLIPKAYTGSFGTNGFKLNFSNNAAATAAALGADSSGNGNNWTPNNLSINTGGPTSVAAASGALPILNTTGTYGDSVDTGVRTDANASSLVLAVPLSTSTGLNLTDQQPSGRTASTKTLTNTGVTNSTTNLKFYGGGGAEFDSGNGDFLTIGNSTDFAFGTGDFTIEFWAYPNVSRSNHIVFATNFSNSSGLLVALDTSTNYRPFVYLGGWFYGASNTLKLNSWNHVAVVRSSGTLYFYVNGVRDSGQAFTATNDASNVQIGRNPTFGTESFNGFLQDLRVYKGAAKYTANFNPPSTTQNATVGAGCDSLVDTPTSYGTDTGAGGEVRGNYCTLNALAGGGTLANGNLDFLGASGGAQRYGTIGVASGKWYWEVTVTAGSGSSLPLLGIGNNPNQAGLVGIFGYYGFNGNKYADSTAAAYGASYTVNDVVSVAFDADNGTLTFYKNGASQGQAFTGISGTYFPYFRADTGTSVVANFGQRPFAYTAPSGFKALCDTNLPAPVVAKPSTVFDTKLYTGNGSTQNITGLGFSPSLVWLKARSKAYNHQLYDVVRGVQKVLRSSTTDAEVSGADLDAFTSTGFTLNSQIGSNENSTPYVSWTWDAGSSTVTNTQGSITSNVRANASAGFSIVSYTGNGSAGATVGHGLGVKPALLIVKQRSAGTTNWAVYHSSLGATKLLQLNTTSAAITYTAGWNDTEPTSTVFSLGTDSGMNGNGSTYVCYAWAPQVGYSSFGSYTGNGSANGPFVYTGFRPRWVMFKRTDPTGENPYNYSWFIIDAARDTYNVVGNFLQPHSSNQENNYFGSVGAGTWMDFLSNGFKVRTNGTLGNANGGTYVWAAFAESPFKYARAR